MNMPYVMKKCSKCGRWLVASTYNFHKQKGCKYGLHSKCKECRENQQRQYYEANKDKERERCKRYREANKDKIAEYHKQYNEANKDKIAEQKKQYYEANKDKITEKNKRYYETNKEKISEHQKRYGKQYYEANKEKVAERKRQYYKDNKEKLLEQKRQYYHSPQGQVSDFNKRQRRRTREQQQGDGITTEQWLELMSFFNWRCAYSGEVLSKDTRSIDHIVPLNSGGEHEIWNLVPMLRTLNSSKHDKDMLEWYRKQDFYDPKRLQKIYKWQEYAHNKWEK